jgi:ABC-type phosphate transport system permease subunit/ABC-type phosphate transport system auxiliary subunit
MSQQVLQPPAKRTLKPMPTRGPAARRPTLPAAHGEPMIWVMGAALVLALCMIVGMFALIITEGSATFWPDPIDKVTLKTGQAFLGIPVKDDEEHDRRLYRVGNRDTGEQPFRWVNLGDVASVEQPKSAVMLERSAWGIWLGEPKALVIQEDVVIPVDQAKQYEAGPVKKQLESGRLEAQKIGEEDGQVRVRQRTYLAEGPEKATEALAQALPQAQARAARIQQLTKHDLGNINHDIEASRLDVRKAEIDAERSHRSRPPMLAWWGVAVVVLAAGACIAGSVKLAAGVTPRSATGRALRAAGRALLLTIALAGLLFAALENPKARAVITQEQLAATRQASAEHIHELETQYNQVRAKIAEIEQEDRRSRAIVIEPAGGRFSPIRQSEPDEPMLVSQIVRMVPANDLTWSGKLGIYFSRWWEYLSDDPRNANTEGGVFPVIFGTVTLTLLLSIVVVPFGVIAALYLREYARQGPLVSLIRIAVNNLAGIPSIVYGVFGFGFFLAKVGVFIDQGPKAPVETSTWWWVIVGAAVVVGIAAGLAAYAKGVQSLRGRSHARTIMGLAWLGAALLAVWAIATVPYFGGLFPEKLPSPTYGTPGLLWAALTLAILTLPVVIVATEEAIAAVPRSVREGSYGCGASKWQTIRRVVLPQALPGIMTGGILAMARGAGEVAPLMLVGAAKVAAELPIDGHFPYIHPERSFMHLGFHIYDLGFQSPDAEAARPLVWTTTLLLVAIVLALNFSAVIARARLRSRVISSSV